MIPGFVLLVLLASTRALCQPAPSPPVDGQAIFAERCAKCHGEQGQGISSAISIAGPSLQAEHDPGGVMAAMEVGPSHMPSFASILSVEQMHAVSEYVTQRIAVIPLNRGDIGRGGKLFRENCAPCHRTAVRGGALVFTGVNAPGLANQSPALIAGAIRWGPGPMPSFGPAVINQQELDSIVEYVRFVQHPPSPGGASLNWYGPVAEGFVAWIVLFVSVAIAGWIEKGGKG